MRAFWPIDEELITLWEYAADLAQTLTGVAAIPVDYADWDQEIVPEKRLAQMKPRLGALEVTSFVSAARHERDGVVPGCPVCSALPDQYALEAGEGRLRPLLSAWDGSDLFTVRGTFETFITSSGREKLGDTGFTNLLLAEVEWG